MEINKYQRNAVQTADYPRNTSIIFPTIGLAGETGEVCEKIKKVIRDNNGVFTDERKKEIAKELGDVLWYVANLSRDLGYSLEYIARLNIEKIESRQARGVLHGDGDNR